MSGYRLVLLFLQPAAMFLSAMSRSAWGERTIMPLPICWEPLALPPLRLARRAVQCLRHALYAVKGRLGGPLLPHRRGLRHPPLYLARDDQLELAHREVYYPCRRFHDCPVIYVSHRSFAAIPRLANILSISLAVSSLMMVLPLT